MNTKVITLIATVVTIAVVFVGIGYAYSAYTVNNENTTDVAYVTVTQLSNDVGDTKPYTFADGLTIQFDTINVNDASTVYYKIRNEVSVSSQGIVGFKCADLGSVKLHATYSGSGSLPSPLIVTVAESTGFNGSGGWVYFLTNNEYNKIYSYCNSSSSEWVRGPDSLQITANGTAYDEPVVRLCYGYCTNPGTPDNSYLASTDGPKKLTGATVTLKASDYGEGDGNVPALASPYLVYYNSNYNNGSPEKSYVEIVNGTKDLLSCEALFDIPVAREFSKWVIEGTDSPISSTSHAQTVKAIYAIQSGHEIEFDDSAFTLNWRDETQNTKTIAITSPNVGANKVVWSSSNSAVATVDQNGKVTAKYNGTTTIVAVVTISGTTYTGDVTVTVNEG